MAYHYSEPERASETHALPDVETFTAHYGDCPECSEMRVSADCATLACHDCSDRVFRATSTGWFFWFCFPGCLPEGDPMGPYPSEDAAVNAAREMAE